MKLIGVSQRVDIVSEYGERRDSLDQNWSTLLSSLGYASVAIPNCPSSLETLLSQLPLEGILLTGGNDLSILSDAKNPASERDTVETALIHYADIHQIPVLGICRGMQLLNVCFGGQLSSVSNHVAVRHSLYPTKENPWGWVAPFEVNSYHQYGLQPNDIGDLWIPLAYAPDDTVEAFMHQNKPFYGWMWHPEREQPFSPQDQLAMTQIFGEANP